MRAYCLCILNVTILIKRESKGVNTMTVQENVIEIRGVTKKFGEFKANNNINLNVKKGEVHALLGENGAGKSTLMNILSGLLQPTSGEIYVNGKQTTIESPSFAYRLGIGMVHQHFMLVDDFTVAENMILGHEQTKNGVLDIRKSRKEIEELSKRYKLHVDPNAKVQDISVGMQQRAEILKIIYRGADILILDEPTAVLTPQEIEELIDIMDTFTSEGKSIILITHKLDEIKQVADRCTVIRRGESVGTVDVKDTTPQELANMMVGRNVSFKVDKKVGQPKEKTLEIKNLQVLDNRKLAAVKNLSLDVHAGEIVGIAGIDGNGQTELIEAITGLRHVEKGEILLEGNALQNHAPRKITESGIGHIPEDRQRMGLVLPMSVEENMALQTYYKEPFSKNGMLKDDEIRKMANQLSKEYDVRLQKVSDPVASLSGGNQQKAIIAREIVRNPSLLIAAQPTRGLDVGAIEYIHKRLIEQRDNGKAVLLLSFELDEIMNVSDRIAVMHAGEIIAIVDATETNEEELGLLMAGVPLNEVRGQASTNDGKERLNIE